MQLKFRLVIVTNCLGKSVRNVHQSSFVLDRIKRASDGGRELNALAENHKSSSQVNTSSRTCQFFPNRLLEESPTILIDGRILRTQRCYVAYLLLSFVEVYLFCARMVFIVRSAHQLHE